MINVISGKYVSLRQLDEPCCDWRAWKWTPPDRVCMSTVISQISNRGAVKSGSNTVWGHSSFFFFFFAREELILFQLIIMQSATGLLAGSRPTFWKSHGFDNLAVKPLRNTAGLSATLYSGLLGSFGWRCWDFFYGSFLPMCPWALLVQSDRNKGITWFSKAGTETLCCTHIIIQLCLLKCIYMSPIWLWCIDTFLRKCLVAWITFTG